MDATSCPPEKKLIDLCDGFLEPGELAELEGHLDACEACSERVNALLTAQRVDSQGKQASKETQLMVSGLLRLGANGPGPKLRAPCTEGDLGRLGRYRLLQVVGEGASSVVYRGVDKLLLRPVIVKAFRPGYCAGEDGKRELLEEARLVARFTNDLVAGLLDLGRDVGTPYLVFPHSNGASLDTLLGSAGNGRQDGGPVPLGPVETLSLAQDLAKGLEEIHRQGLVHRDIKPANLWVESPSGRLKILDLGLALVNGDTGWQSWAGGVVGTPGFMSPEQAAGKEIDQKSDLFSLGCVLYWLTTGRYPFQGPDLLSTLSALATVEPAPPTTECPGVPARVSDLVMRLLDKNPENRPVSARVLAEDIGALERELFPSIRSG